jgi:hypothetical protein
LLSKYESPIALLSGEGLADGGVELNDEFGTWFDGVDDVVYQDLGTSDQGALGACTIKATFFYPVAPATFYVIYAHGTVAYRLYINASNELLLNNGLVGASLTPGTLYFTEVDYNSSGEAIALRLNGVDQGIGTATTAATTGTNFEIGSRNSGLYFKGVIHSVSISGGPFDLTWLGTGPDDSDWLDQNPLRLKLPGLAGHYSYVAHESTFDVSELDVRFKCLVFDPGGTDRLVSKRHAGDVPWDISWNVNIQYLNVYDGTTTISLGEHGVAEGSVTWFRVTIEPDAEPGKRRFTGYKSDDGVTWTQFATTLSNTSGPLNTNSSNVQVGAWGNGANGFLEGEVYAVQLLDQIGGTPVLDISYDDADRGDTTFPARTGQTVNVVGASSEIGANDGTVSGSPDRAAQLADGSWTNQVDEWRDNGHGRAKGTYFDGVDDKAETVGTAILPTTADFRLDFKVTVPPHTLTGSEVFIGQRSISSDQVMIGITTGGDFRLYVGTPAVDSAPYTEGKEYSCSLTRRGDDFTLSIEGMSDISRNAPGHTLAANDLHVGVMHGYSTYANVIVRDVRVYDASDVLTHHWPGTGPDAWDDLVGGENMTVTGSPSYAVTTPTGYRKANDLPATVAFKIGVDTKGKVCALGTGTEWGQVTYDGAIWGGNYVRGVVFKQDNADTALAGIVDGDNSARRNAVTRYASGEWVMLLGGLGVPGPSTDQDWHYAVIVQNGSNDQFWVDGVRYSDAAAGTAFLSGVSLLATYDGLNPFDGRIAEVIDIINLTDVDQAVTDMNRYLKWRSGL